MNMTDGHYGYVTSFLLLSYSIIHDHHFFLYIYVYFIRMEICQDDWLEIYNMYRDNTEKLIGRYCGNTAPGPVESTLGALGLRVILHSDSELVYSGFKARYTFEVAKPIFGGNRVFSM